ncbi:hypothetical protein [Mycobacteroides abscessus]|uniref:hypothetical protein n=1 Tax=Mycobacteroides abscessus TaxID=36809 RepID=UPI00232F5372|nr:hypothetical protein [Mycobacteroides abscessus]MDB2305398.1 hypothetical protein [Mycobacteroides abscessus subsp. massiliense]
MELITVLSQPYFFARRYGVQSRDSSAGQPDLVLVVGYLDFEFEGVIARLPGIDGDELMRSLGGCESVSRAQSRTHPDRYLPQVVVFPGVQIGQDSGVFDEG